jgi:hypothetical protein
MYFYIRTLEKVDCSSTHIAHSDKWNERHEKWAEKDTVGSDCDLLQSLSEEIKKTRKISVNIASILQQVWTEYIQNASLQCYLYINLLEDTQFLEHLLGSTYFVSSSVVPYSQKRVAARIVQSVEWLVTCYDQRSVPGKINSEFICQRVQISCVQPKFCGIFAQSKNCAANGSETTFVSRQRPRNKRDNEPLLGTH